MLLKCRSNVTNRSCISPAVTSSKYFFLVIFISLTLVSSFLLQNNTILVVESGSFQNQGQLLELALNGNRIHMVTADMFRGLEHLRILYLAGNDITRLLDYTFRGLQVRHIRRYVGFPLDWTCTNFNIKLDTELCKMPSEASAQHSFLFYSSMNLNKWYVTPCLCSACRNSICSTTV